MKEQQISLFEQMQSTIRQNQSLSGGTCAGSRKTCRETSVTHTGAETQAAQTAHTYPSAPGYKRDGTSKDAAEEIECKASVLRIKCLWSLKQYPQTADEIAKYWNKSVLAIRPRISELVARGKIEDSGLRRKNVSGKSAIVWRAK